MSFAFSMGCIQNFYDAKDSYKNDIKEADRQSKIAYHNKLVSLGVLLTSHLQAKRNNKNTLISNYYCHNN